MKHLFIINPFATKVRGKVNEIVEKITLCMDGHRDLAYDVHVTRWSRDAVGFVRRYVSTANETVRVHSVGGTGTLYEVVNGVINLPNAEVAVYPYGNSNEFIQYFMRKNMVFFKSIESQLVSDTIMVDAITDGTNYGVANFLTGIEADAYIAGSEIGKKIRFNSDLFPKLVAGFKLLTRRYLGNDYKILLDGKIDISGKYVSIMTANTPCYQKKLNPAIDAHPNDGLLEIYTANLVSRWKYFKGISAYTSGNYAKVPDIFTHYTCKSIQIECDNVMRTSFDGEVLFSKKIEFSVVPSVIKVVVPNEIDLTQIPKTYQG